MRSNVIVALEGLVHAGKTTLLDVIKKEADGSICCIDEYSMYKGKIRFPDFPKTSSEALSVNQFFVELEEKRFSDITQSRIVLLDRSLLSVLAYHYATEWVSEGRILCFDQSLRLFREQFLCYMPNVVIWLNISARALICRHRTERGFYKPILLDREFNRGIVSFYGEIQKYFPETTVYKIDADQSKKGVWRDVSRVLSVV